jgi:carboxylesterase type B
MIFLRALLEYSPFMLPPALVTLTSGTFRGLTVNNTDHWLGIPYAQPPVGSLRFKSPAPISRPAKAIQDALRFSPACPQPLTTAPVSEDCLFLNVRSKIYGWH